MQVARGAPDAAIKAAYRRLQKKYHPDNSQVHPTTSSNHCQHVPQRSRCQAAHKSALSHSNGHILCCPAAPASCCKSNNWSFSTPASAVRAVRANRALTEHGRVCSELTAAAPCAPASALKPEPRTCICKGDAARSADINLAYRTLTDRGERARYDSELRRNGPPPTAARYWHEGFPDPSCCRVWTLVHVMIGRPVAGRIGAPSAAGLHAMPLPGHTWLDPKSMPGVCGRCQRCLASHQVGQPQ